jgi:hypothetical protein
MAAVNGTVSAGITLSAYAKKIHFWTVIIVLILSRCLSGTFQVHRAYSMKSSKNVPEGL